jgi:hypothetical protein
MGEPLFGVRIGTRADEDSHGIAEQMAERLDVLDRPVDSLEHTDRLGERYVRVYVMSVKSKATAEVFFTAFKALPKEERDEVLVRIAGDRSLRLDLLDLAALAERQQEPSRPFNEYLSDRDDR